MMLSKLSTPQNSILPEETLEMIEDLHKIFEETVLPETKNVLTQYLFLAAQITFREAQNP